MTCSFLRRWKRASSLGWYTVSWYDADPGFVQSKIDRWLQCSDTKCQSLTTQAYPRRRFRANHGRLVHRMVSETRRARSPRRRPLAPVCYWHERMVRCHTTRVTQVYHLVIAGIITIRHQKPMGSYCSVYPFPHVSLPALS